MCLLAAGCSGSSSVTTAPAATSAPTVPPNARPVTVIEVIDGDSVRVEEDGTQIEIRLLGINAPERDECWSEESRRELAASLDGAVGLVAVEEDRFGRTLGYLFADSDDVGRDQVASGAAIALASGHQRLPDYLAAEEEAATLERGLWGRSACGTGTSSEGVRIWAIEPDAPGRDDRNPNGEFVAITNEGADADLTGWAIRDESSQHRYRFPDGFVLERNEIITIRSGCGDDTATDLYWCADGTVWTNSGDTVLLLDPTGSVVERRRYTADG